VDKEEYALVAVLFALAAVWLLYETDSTDTEVADLTDPRGIRNNNPLNLKYIAGSPYNGQTGQDADGFGIYSSWQLGVRAGGLQLTKNFNNGADTVASLVQSWSTTDIAPYQNFVAAQLGVSVSEPLDWTTDELPYVMAAIQFENGENPYASADVQAALQS
jgi:hypothetical protein